MGEGTLTFRPHDPELAKADAQLHGDDVLARPGPREEELGPGVGRGYVPALDGSMASPHHALSAVLSALRRGAEQGSCAITRG